jgi:type VI secretion system protein ImpA
MSAIDVDKLLEEISADAPCGDNLEYDPAFGEMERAAQSKPEQQIGDTIVPAEEPDWRALRGQALEVLGRTKDLRAITYLTNALLATDGLRGFTDGLALLQYSLEKYWESVHPQLDPEDDNDPTMRVNTIVSLCDPDRVLRKLNETPLVSSRMVGRFSLRDINIASGVLSAPANAEEPPPEMGTIDAAFMDVELEALQADAAAVEAAIGHVHAIDALLMDRVGAGNAPDLDALPAVLKQIQHVLAERLMRRGVAVAGVEGEGGGASDAAGAPGQALTGEIRTTDDVMRALDKICDYYHRYEPSSPVPLLIMRAKRLVSKNFMDILRDLTPDGVAQMDLIRGMSSSEE